MEFMKIQDKNTRQVIRWFIDKSEVTQSTFENKKEELMGQGKRYNTSYTLRDGKTDDFIHVHHLN
ncbi:hypothetical protein [Maribacter polysaccharolyticus]|uniref:hypothetical protein n=1 Tax=Maribacter polysaccharolyticus TaxID=3020831 RepID=UPI00237F2F4F|nr:hypothetical protein [Maribacter polysaccharolyticus]MDE3744003.1 hypothetical protein [Maribacter polysaccharolyticus]